MNQHHKKHYTGHAKYLNRFDEKYLKPIFIYKYEKNMQKQSKQFFELFLKQGDEIEAEFKKDQSGLSRRHTLRDKPNSALD